MKTYILLGMALLSAHLSFSQTNKAEVFLQIEDRGNFTVYLDNELVGSSKGRFRFYDVDNASPSLTILQGNKRIFNGRINVHPEQRLVLTYTLRSGLKTINELKIYRNGQYALNDFDNYTGSYNTGIVPPTIPNGNSINPFNSLLAMVKKEPFDDDKIKVIQAYTVHSYLSTAQTAVLLKTFNQDDKKLFLAKNLVPVISDLQNYYTLKEEFTFLSSKDEFLKFLNESKSSRRRRDMSATIFEQLRLSVKREAFDDDKTKVIQASIQNSAPSTVQISELLKLYSFEDKALICAKMTYNFVSDQQRFFTLKDVFKFRSNQDSLLEFLGQK
ncbi:DUF4476 domain-containing protein [Pedobacter sp. LMG 31464]|uniref:DUF4476 domain-containing protein n=1 Tax=Pedobacter planticolens TaxID=2679964 RepID=A0A923DZH7_9SPHI|nr:DUF4476 domain-containing protein [Pedobacter planticolens]MBB2145960.1 DUF4476 domain-containing protein [Pedobacter planticolens]